MNAWSMHTLILIIILSFASFLIHIFRSTDDRNITHEWNDKISLHETEMQNMNNL